MKLSEAYTTLGLTQNSSKEEAKKAFRKLAAKYHPDVNKDPDAESNFKKINEAYQIVDSGKPTTPDFIPPNSGSGPGGYGWNVDFSHYSDIWDLFNNVGYRSQGRARTRFVQDINLSATISFKDSVTGCRHSVEYDRTIHCDKCEGLGQKNDTTACQRCMGRGSVIERHGNAIMQMPCPECKGKPTYIQCKDCNGEGCKNIKYSGTVSIPAGITDGVTLRLAGMGNWNGAMYSNTNLKISVTSEPGLQLEGHDVIYNLTMPFLDSLKGATKSIPTIDGFKDIKIPALSRHKEEITLPQLGVNRQGNQRIILNIEKPNKVNEIIELLERE